MSVYNMFEGVFSVSFEIIINKFLLFFHKNIDNSIITNFLENIDFFGNLNKNKKIIVKV